MAIIIISIRLAELEFKIHPEHAGNLNFDIGFSCKSEYPEPNHLIQTTEFDLARGMEDAPFTFKFKYISEFRSDGEGPPTIEEFAEANAPAYIVPYARELIADITARLGVVPPLILPPINVLKLVQEAKERTEQWETETKPD